jgi:hypothetical protein
MQFDIIHLHTVKLNTLTFIKADVRKIVLLSWAYIKLHLGALRKTPLQLAYKERLGKFCVLCHRLHKLRSYVHITACVPWYNITIFTSIDTASENGFGGLVVSMLASGIEDRGFAPGRSSRIFRTKKSSACLSSEGK